MALQIPTVQPFTPHGEPNALSQKWEKWKKSFQYFIEASGITAEARKKALLLQLVGTDTQDIFETLNPAKNSYESALAALDTHFAVRKNIAFERSIFHKARQHSNESIGQIFDNI